MYGITIHLILEALRGTEEASTKLKVPEVDHE